MRDAVVIHDAFLLPAGASEQLNAAIQAAGREWLLRIGPIYDMFEKYLPKSSPEGRIARRWHRPGLTDLGCDRSE